MLQVVETFVSINGEGAHAGVLAAFIRLRGCNLNCSYCDTRWANSADAPATDYTAEQLRDWVASTHVKNVTITGGEPLLWAEVDELITLLLDNGNRVEIETNGSVPLRRYIHHDRRPVFTMDYKLPGSGMEQHMNTANFALLGEHDAVKFVCGSDDDLRRAVHIIRGYDLTGICHVYLSPVFGKLDPARMVEFMTKENLNGVRLQLQLHKFIWEPDKRGV